MGAAIPTAYDIPLAAQIVGVVEVYDALTTGWHHQPALPKDKAIEYIQSCASWWSAQVTEAFNTAARSWGVPEMATLAGSISTLGLSSPRAAFAREYRE